MKNKIKIFGIIFLITALLLVSSCVKDDFKGIKTDEYVGKTITVKGTVENAYKLLGLSGYTLKDKNGEPLQVKSETLPKEGDEASVEGVLMKDSIFGYYLKANK